MKALNCKGRLLPLDQPVVMGILNITPDSFYAGSRKQTEAEIAARAEAILQEGGTIIDIGGYSSRPDAAEVSEEEEMARLETALRVLNLEFPGAVLSVDTFRSAIARRCVEEFGVAIVNDISGGELDKDMFHTIADLRVPYVMMHMRGTPQTMQQHTQYEHLTADILQWFAAKLETLYQMGANDVIIDPGFGFAKTAGQNFELLAGLHRLCAEGYPVLAGLSRKSMIYRTLGTTPDEALPGTIALGWECLRQGASILRVHDVREAVDTVRLFEVFERYRG